MLKMLRFCLQILSPIPIIFFVLIVLIAVIAPWSYDEAWSYIEVESSTFTELILYTKFKIANNHILNSLWFKLLQSLGLKNVFFYRLISVLSYWVYVYALGELLSKHKKNNHNHNYLGILALFLLFYTMYFTLGRGYGLAIATFTLSLVFFKRVVGGSGYKDLLLFVLFGCISSLSIFSFCYGFLGMLAYLFVTQLSSLIKSPKRILILSISIPVILYVYVMGKVVSTFDTNIIGSTSLVQNGTVSSLISAMSLNWFVPYKLFLIFRVSLAITLVLALAALLARKKFYTEHILFLVTILLMFLSHLLTGAYYPLYRSVSYLIVLLYLPLVYSNYRKHSLIIIHLIVVIGIGVYNYGSIVYRSSQNGVKDALTYISKDMGGVLVEDMNYSPRLLNQIYFNNSITVVNCMVADSQCFNAISDTVKYIICRPERLQAAGKTKSFEAISPVAIYLFNDKVLYKRVD